MAVARGNYLPYARTVLSKATSGSGTTHASTSGTTANTTWLTLSPGAGTTTVSTLGSYIVPSSTDFVSWECDDGRRYPEPSLEEQLITLSGLIDVLERDHLKLKLGQQRFTLDMPDGSTVFVDERGNYRIEDQDAQVVYKANRLREFNRYVNASDLLEEFIDFVHGVGGVGKDAFLALPVELFIRWLVIRAAQADGEIVPADEEHALTQRLLPAPKPRHRCRGCGRFVRRAKAEAGLSFCTPDHYARFEQRIAA